MLCRARPKAGWRLCCYCACGEDSLPTAELVLGVCGWGGARKLSSSPLCKQREARSKAEALVGGRWLSSGLVHQGMEAPRAGRLPHLGLGRVSSSSHYGERARQELQGKSADLKEAFCGSGQGLCDLQVTTVVRRSPQPSRNASMMEELSCPTYHQLVISRGTLFWRPCSGRPVCLAALLL